MPRSQHAQAVAAAAANTQASRPKGRRPTAPATPKPKHSISNVRPVRERYPTPAASRRQATPARPVARPRASACPNTACTAPNVEDGVCHSCGTIVDESNIVSEVTFGENAAGAAVLQGTFIGDGKTHANTMGASFNRLGGSGDDSGGHVDAIREGTEVINGLKQAFKLDEDVVQYGLQMFKYAANANFCQGRRISIVAACSLYAAARASKSEKFNQSNFRNYQCKVMLIDFADHLGINVFQVGRTFKVMLDRLSMFDIPMLVPEDLMLRFAIKLDFGFETTRVATTAVKLAQRMQQDWMLTGRRPAGICGACILMAARIHNFRRTVQEVVYVVKVTSSTVEKRLDEFKYTAASSLTVDEFLNNAPATSEHDPPAFYQQTEEYKKTRKTRKRKRGTETQDHGDDEGNREGSEDSDRERSTSTSTSSSPTPEPTSQPQIDADGFAIPALPARKKARNGANKGKGPARPQGTAASPSASAASNTPNDIPIEPSLLREDGTDEIEDLTHLARNLGDRSSPHSDAATSPAPIPVEEEDFEANIEREITGLLDQPETRERVSDVVASLRVHPPNRGHIEAQFNDPNSEVHRLHFEIAKHQADLVAHAVATSITPRLISMDVHIGEDEFADDDEVTGCLLSPEEINIKEKIWYNENRDWLVKQTEKEQKKKEDAKRPKAKRVRKKVDKIGAGQKEPMATSHEAAIAALNRRTGRNRGGVMKSKKINYKAIEDLMLGADGSVPSSSSTSRATSVVPRTRRAGSTKLTASSRAGSRASSVMSEVASVAGESDFNSNAGSVVDVGNGLMDQFEGDEDMDDIGFDEEDLEPY